MILLKTKRVIFDIVLLLYSLWNAFVVIRGILSQLTMLFSPDFTLRYIADSWYVYVGSWISYVLLLVSSFRCICAIIRFKSWNSVIMSGIIGQFAYIVPMITFSIYREKLHIGSIYSLTPMCIVFIGIWGNMLHYNNEDEYTPLLARIIHKNSKGH